MMEFTLARVSACICGVMVIAILFNPVVSSYDDGASDLNGENCEALDRFFGTTETGHATDAVCDYIMKRMKR